MEDTEGMETALPHETKQVALWDYSFDTPTAIVVGGEGDGIREKTAEHCDTLIAIPMENAIESLNASVSSALVCYEIMRQRRG